MPSPFLLTRYFLTRTGSEKLARTGALSIIAACRAARDAARGLQHAHEHGLIHRDLKPHNLMQTADGTVKILDFGLAVLSDAARGEGGLTGENVVLGTPDYIAPEQAEDSHAADIRSDIYSLGCTLYHLLTGQLPFPAVSVLKKLDAHRTVEPEPIRNLRSEVPAELAAVVSRMMAKKPADRFQTPAEVAEALEPFTRPFVSKPPRKRGPLVLAAALLALIGLVIGVANGTHIYRIVTNKGEIVISADGDEVEVSIRKGGEEITVLDTRTKTSIVLDSGQYELRLKGAPSGLKLELEKVTLKRGDVRIATIVRVPAEPPPVKEPPGLIHQVDFVTLDSRNHARVNVHIFGTAFSPDGQYFLAGFGPAGHDAIRAAVPALRADLWDAKLEVRRKTVEQLALLGPPANAAVPDLLELFEDDDKSLRLDVAAAVVRVSSDRAAQGLTLLTNALKQQDYRLAGAAAQTLGELGPLAQPAVPALVAALGRRNCYLAALDALERLGPTARGAIPALLKRLPEEQEALSWRPSSVEWPGFKPTPIRDALKKIDRELARELGIH